MSAKGVGSRRGSRWLAVTGAGLWLLVFLFSLVVLWAAARFPFLMTLAPADRAPIPEVLDWGMEWIIWLLKSPARWFAWAMEIPISWLQAIFLTLPWPFFTLGAVALAYWVSGMRLAGFVGFVMLYTLLAGFWTRSALTLSVVALAFPLATLLGLVLGLIGDGHASARRGLNALLDFMQTIPAFAYLIPCLILFGFGPTVGLIASVIFATPPMARNVLLGLSRVPSETLEAALMAGATRRQILWLVKIPSAMPTILVGVNQTILATLSMVVLSAVVGSGEDLGWEVLDKMRRAEFGKSLLAGFNIVLIAMLLDRLSRALAVGYFARQGTFKPRRALAQGMIGGGAILVISLIGAAFVPEMRSFPKEWVFSGAGRLDEAISWINRSYPEVTTAIKNTALFYFLLPLKLGLDDVISPFSWGVNFTPFYKGAYMAGFAVAPLALWWRGKGQGALFTAYLGFILYVGTTHIPWPVFALPVAFLAYRTGGRNVALFAVLAMGFILLTGLWTRAMTSVYLCGAAVFVSLVFGLGLGIAAALNDRVSRLLSPINDMLQSIPLFVFLIPVVALFKVGDFAGLLAIVMYAIVPVIRYTEHGIRQVSPEILEAARLMGCTKRQLLSNVQLPLAVPEIMLGINQTILFSLAMLVVSALIGTTGLGQVIYRSLATGRFGEGIAAGLAMAFIAMIADRIIQSWSRKRKEALGLIES